MAGPPRTLHLGPDRIREHQDLLIIESPADMPELEYREYRKIVVRFRERLYTVREKRRDPAFFTYVLEPCTPSPQEAPPRILDYDETFVTIRDEAARNADRLNSEVAGAALSPLLGFLPERVKRRLCDRLGVDVNAAGYRSLFLEYLLLLSTLVLLLLHVLTRVFAGWGLALITAAVVLLVDAIARKDALDRERSAPGFLEWLFISKSDRRRGP